MPLNRSNDVTNKFNQENIMPIPETISLTWVLNKAWILLVGYIWYHKKNSDADAKKREVDIVRLEKEDAKAKLTFVTEARVKEVIREELVRFKEDSKEIKALLDNLTEQLATLTTEMAVQNAINNLNQKDKK